MTLPLRRRAAAALLSLSALALALPTATAQAAPPSTSTPDAGALRGVSLGRTAKVGDLRPGEARMGWSQAPVVSLPSGTVGLQAAKKKAFVPTGVLGIDVSGWQGRVNWGAQVRAGKAFAYVKATEGSSFRNRYFRSQYNGSYAAGMIRGAYHFANPGGTSGASQARFFVRNGGGWSADGRTLPGVLDIEYNPYGSTCYGLSQKKMVSWIALFIREYRRLTGRDVVIYTTTNWWQRCTGNTARFSNSNPLWLARYGTTSPGKLPGTWKWATFWQYTSTPIDQNRFSSSYQRLKVLATNAR